MRALVTGVNGFVGQHLARHLAASGDEVVGLVKPGTEKPPGIVTIEADIRDGVAVERAVAAARPAALYHLAALSHVGASWQQRRETVETNLLGSLGVLEAARKLEPLPRVLLVGSAEAYGRVESLEPVEESTPLRPLTPYGASKAAQEVLGRQYWDGDGLPVVLVRPFNHSGPGQAPSFVVPEWARAVAEMELGLRPQRLEVGNLEAERDFSDVRDIVRLYRLLALEGQPGEAYNACSGRARTIGGVLERLRALARVSFVVQVRADARPAEVRRFVGSPLRAERELGWRRDIDFDQTLADVLAEWRARLGPGA